MTAPAGSILMYHSGTWHRISANLSASPRIGIAQSFVPDFIVEEYCPGGPQPIMLTNPFRKNLGNVWRGTLKSRPPNRESGLAARGGAGAHGARAADLWAH